MSCKLRKIRIKVAQQSSERVVAKHKDKQNEQWNDSICCESPEMFISFLIFRLRPSNTSVNFINFGKCLTVDFRALRGNIWISRNEVFNFVSCTCCICFRNCEYSLRLEVDEMNVTFAFWRAKSKQKKRRNVNRSWWTCWLSAALKRILTLKLHTNCCSGISSMTQEKRRWGSGGLWSEFNENFLDF